MTESTQSGFPAPMLAKDGQCPKLWTRAYSIRDTWGDSSVKIPGPHSDLELLRQEEKAELIRPQVAWHDVTHKTGNASRASESTRF